MYFLTKIFLFLSLTAESFLSGLTDASQAESSQNQTLKLDADPEESVQGRSKRETTENKKLLLNRLLRETDDLFRTYRTRPSATCSTGGRKPIGVDLWCPRMNPLRSGRQAWTCINSKDMCNQRSTCPLSDDEEPIHCMFYKAVYIQLNEVKSLIVDVLTHKKPRAEQHVRQ